MTDSTHNTLVTILLLIAAIIVFILLGRWFQTGTFTRYSYQPASAIGVYDNATYVPAYYSQQGVVSIRRSRPSYTYTQPVTQTQYESSSYQSTYSYSCDGMGHCWTNQ